MTRLFYQNPRLLIVTLALIIVGGLAAYTSLPRMEDPRLTNRYSFIVTHWPGASAQRVESLVTEPVERALQPIKEIYKMISRSRAGVSVLQIELADDVPPQAVDEVWSRMRDRLADAALKLPEGASYPAFDNDDAESYTTLIALVWNPSDSLNYTPPNHAILTRPAQRLEDRLRNLHGTEHTKQFGASTEEIHVDIQPQQLAQLGMSPTQLASQIKAADATIASGQLRSNTNDLIIEVSGELDQLERVRQIPLRFGAEGQFVRLGDIATVTKHATDPATQLALVDGQHAIVIAARMTRDAQIDLWSQDLYNILDDFQHELSPQLQVRVIFDQAHYTQKRLGILVKSFALAILAVCAVVLIIMGWRAAVIVCFTLPLASLMVLIGLDYLGLPIHQMSIMGLVIALGLLIDNAIVMVDETNQRLRTGLPPTEAIHQALKQLATPLIGSTLTTVLAFMPIVLMPGAAGEFVGGIAVGVILALFSSLFLSLTIVPAIAAMLYNPNNTQHGYTHPALKSLYTQFIDFFLAHPALGIIISLILPTLGFISGSQLPEQFFPAADRDMFQIQLRLPRQTSIRNTHALTQDASQLILQNSRVKSIHWFVGDSAPMFFYNMNTGENNSPHFAQAMVKLDNGDNLNALTQQLQEQLNQSFPQAESLVLPFQQGPPFDAPIELYIQGPDLDTLYTLGQEARAILANTPGIVHARATLASGRPTLKIKLDDDEARLAGLSNRAVAQQLEASLEGAVGGQLIEDVVAMPIRIRLAKKSRDTLNEVASMNLYSETPTNAPSLPIPLNALGTTHIAPQMASIERRNTQRTNTILGFTTAGILPSRILDQFQNQLEAANFQLPTGYSLKWGGESGERDRAVGALLASAAFLIVLMGTCLILSLGSFRQTLLIALVAFASVGLGLGTLVLFNFPFGFTAIIGIMGLVGLAINDSIVVLAALNHNPDAKQGDPTAIRNTILQSTRHVLATTLTTMAGFLPLMLSGGSFWPPLAIIIGGGVAGATFLALVLIPAAYKIIATKNTPVTNSAI